MNMIDRRKLLIRGAMTVGSLPLRALVTGLPISYLGALSRPAHAQVDIPLLADPQYLIMSLSGAGDPVNNNAPGTYANDPNDSNDPKNMIIHPRVAEVGEEAAGFEIPVEFQLGAQTVKAAQPWSNLDSDLRQRFAFWHHGTFVNAHPEFGAARRLNDAVRSAKGNSSEELTAMIAEHTVDSLSCITRETLTVGGSTTTVDGRRLPALKPKDLRKLFGDSAETIDQTVILRDRFLDQAYAQVRANGTPAEKRFFDRYAKSKAEAAQMGDALGALISDVDSNDERSQIKCAVALIQLNIAPIVTMAFDFGVDSHADDTLAREVTRTNTAIGDINFLWQSLKAVNLEDKVTFASLNTFGRTGYRNSNGGRDHNGAHHAMFLFGKNVKGGVIGGVETKEAKRGVELKATGINSAGRQDRNHDIAFEDSFTSVGKTLCKAVGMENESINQRILGGKIITGALSA